MDFSQNKSLKRSKTYVKDDKDLNLGFAISEEQFRKKQFIYIGSISSGIGKFVINIRECEQFDSLDEFVFECKH